jgi:ribosomal protein S18 acetylase RimI-like enzyme
VSAVASRVHPEFPESDAVFAERLALWPGGCLVADGPEGVAGYAVSHPWIEGSPALDSLVGALPDRPDFCYVHDVAIRPQARGRGLGAAVVPILAAQARALGLPMSLVAIYGAEVFWGRHGFRATGPAPAYGPGALRMVRPLDLNSQ